MRFFLNLFTKIDLQQPKIIFVCCALFFIPESNAKDTKLHSYIIEKILPQTNRIQQFEWEGKKYWLKKETTNKIFWGHQLTRELGAAIIPISFLKPTPYRDKNPLQLEKERLLECEQLKVNCPHIIDSETYWLAMTDAGVSAEIYLKTLSKTQKFEFVLKLIKTIFENQKKGFFHGRYYLRDMLISSTEEIFVFDIEENPTQIMDIPDVKAREIFHFIVSVLTVLEAQETKQLGLWLNKHLDEETKKRLLTLEQHTIILKLFDFFKDYLGRDPARFLNAAFFILDNLKV